MTERRSRLSGLLAALGLFACQPAPEFAVNGPCTVAASPRDLPDTVRETSGLTLSRRSPGVLWTNNDSGNEPILYALDTTGTFLGQVRVTSAEVVDWEDIAAGPCDTGDCLFIGDFGDNRGRRDSISIYVVPEPLPTDSATAPAIVLNARYPDRAQDAEAMFLLPGGDLFIVTKGRRDSIGLYRYPKAAQRPGGSVTLERVRTLAARPAKGDDRVTGAAATSNGERVAIRSYRWLQVYNAEGLLHSGLPTLTFDLRPLDEAQGEGVAIDSSGRVWLSSEAEGRRHPPVMSRLRCSLGG